MRSKSTAFRSPSRSARSRFWTTASSPCPARVQVPDQHRNERRESAGPGACRDCARTAISPCRGRMAALRRCSTTANPSRTDGICAFRPDLHGAARRVVVVPPDNASAVGKNAQRTRVCPSAHAILSPRYGRPVKAVVLRLSERPRLARAGKCRSWPLVIEISLRRAYSRTSPAPGDCRRV